MLWPQLFDSESNKQLVICQAVTLWKNQILLPVGHHLSSGAMVFAQPQSCFQWDPCLECKSSSSVSLPHVYEQGLLSFRGEVSICCKSIGSISQKKNPSNNGNCYHPIDRLSCFSIFQPFLKWQIQDFHFSVSPRDPCSPGSYFFPFSAWVCGSPVLLQYFWLGLVPCGSSTWEFVMAIYTMKRSLFLMQAPLNLGNVKESSCNW